MCILSSLSVLFPKRSSSLTIQSVVPSSCVRCRLRPLCLSLFPAAFQNQSQNELHEDKAAAQDDLDAVRERGDWVGRASTPGFYR